MLTIENLVAAHWDTWKKWITEAGGTWIGVQQALSSTDPLWIQEPVVCFTGKNDKILRKIRITDMTEDAVYAALGRNRIPQETPVTFSVEWIRAYKNLRVAMEDFFKLTDEE